MEQIKKRNYVFVLDFEIGRVYRYDGHVTARR